MPLPQLKASPLGAQQWGSEGQGALIARPEAGGGRWSIKGKGLDQCQAGHQSPPMWPEIGAERQRAGGFLRARTLLMVAIEENTRESHLSGFILEAS